MPAGRSGRGSPAAFVSAVLGPGSGWQPRPTGIVEGQCDLQVGTCAGPAMQPEVAAERFGPVLEPDQAGSVAEAGAAAAVVADAHVQDAVTGLTSIWAAVAWACFAALVRASETV